MTESVLSGATPVSEPVLRELSRDPSRVIPNFSEKEPSLVVKELFGVITPILDTAYLPELSASHRAAACNILCAIIEKCQASDCQYARDAILDDLIWCRLFKIYLERSDSAKTKSIRQVLLVLTGVLLKNECPRSLQLQNQAVTSFIDIICKRQDRVKVKPALQGVAHFLQKDVVTVSQLIQIYSSLQKPASGFEEPPAAQALFTAFLSWIVHHDTSLSAGHLIKNFLTQIRRSTNNEQADCEKFADPIWMRPVVDSLREWPDRVQEFKTHVFPHCFLPNIDEYLKFLSFLHFRHHVISRGPLPYQINLHCGKSNGLEDFEEFKVLLAAIETGKELGIVKDIDYRLCSCVEVHETAIHLPDDILGRWLSHLEPEVRLAGLFLSIYSTAVTRPITGGIFKSLKRNLIHLHTDTYANFRRVLLGYTQKLFDRLRGSTATLMKTQTKATAWDQNRLSFPRRCFQRHQWLQKGLMEEPLLEALHFTVWYTHFLEGELRSDASYQRRISALRALIIVLKSGVDPHVPHQYLSKRAQGQLRWVHGLQITTSRLIRVLLDLVLDPFDDIRETSIAALHLCLASLPNGDRKPNVTRLPRFIARAETTMLRTGRADQADGVARAYALYFSISSLNISDTITTDHNGDMPRIEIFSRLYQQLRTTLEVAHRNLSEAVDGRPVHGVFAALRYIIDQDCFYSDIDSLNTDLFLQWKQIHSDVLASLNFLWTCIKNPLCADAPEGHVPEELEYETSLDTKEILSYSWRGLKEASVLLRVIISRAPIGTHDRAIVQPEVFEQLGRLSFTQLVELRHRGAFSTVAQTFATFCRRSVSSDNDALRTLPERWYEETLLSIKAKANSITRRSGGIPALMAGIIAAEPQPGGKLFPRAMHDLISEASANAESANIEESNLPQVHALNCIKEIFTTSRLSVASETYIAEGLELAARTLNSKIWPIRNCSLMLFKALIERLLGSDEAQDWKERDRAKTSRFSYNNYPSLISMIEGLLDPEGPLKKSLDMPDSNSPMDLHGAEGVFPALQILRQATPPEENRVAILQYVQTLLPSPHWHLRDMTARTATSLYRQHEMSSWVKWLLAAINPKPNPNHGTLLCLKYALKNAMQDSAEIDAEYLKNVMLDLSNRTNEWYTQINCPITKAAFLDLVSLCGMAVLKLPICDSIINTWTELTASVSIGPEQAIDLNEATDNALLQRSLAQVFFIDRAILRPKSLGTMMSSKYQSIGDALLLLTEKNADICCAALDTLDGIVQSKRPQGPLMQISLILRHVYQLVRDARDPEVLSKAQAVLADGLSQEDMAEGVLDLIKEDDMLTTLDKLERQCLEGAPSNMQSALHLLGFFLDWTYKTYRSRRQTLLEKISQYIKLLRMTIIDTNPFDDRFAAVQSVSALCHIWTLRATSKAESSLSLGLAFVLYDMLNDDDDEIRDAAALATTKLLQTQQRRSIKPVVPILTTHRLAEFLVDHFSFSQDLYKEAVRRLIGTPSRGPLFASSFVDTFVKARKEDTALFSAEKQNLFKDDTLDAVLWSRVLCALPRTSVPPFPRHGLRTWVLDALLTLIATARNKIDGALGWSSKPEVFTLGMRVLCAAEVVLKWNTLHADNIKVNAMLMDFADVGKKNEVHGLWMRKVDDLLEKNVVDMISTVGAELRTLQERLYAEKAIPAARS